MTATSVRLLRRENAPLNPIGCVRLSHFISIGRGDFFPRHLEDTHYWWALLRAKLEIGAFRVWDWPDDCTRGNHPNVRTSSPTITRKYLRVLYPICIFENFFACSRSGLKTVHNEQIPIRKDSFNAYKVVRLGKEDEMLTTIFKSSLSMPGETRSQTLDRNTIDRPCHKFQRSRRFSLNCRTRAMPSAEWPVSYELRSPDPGYRKSMLCRVYEQDRELVLVSNYQTNSNVASEIDE